MMTHRLALLLLSLVVSSHGLQYVRRQTFKSEEAKNGRTSLTIRIDIPGNIKWKSDSSNRVHFMVTSRATEPQELDRVYVDYKESGDSIKLHIRSLPEPPSYAAQGAGNGAKSLYSSPLPVVFISVMFYLFTPCSGHKYWNLGAIFLLWFVHDPGGHVVETRLLVDKDAAVTILVPRRFLFSSVTLHVSEGEIEVDPALVASSTPLECTTNDLGSPGCDWCCSGRGICGEHNMCICGEGYKGTGCENQTSAEFTVFINPADIRLMSTQTTNGETIDLYGKRMFNGSVRSLNAMKLRRVDGRHTTVKLGKRYRVKRITSSSGSRMDLKWRGRHRIYVKAVTADGKSQVNVNVRLKRLKTKQTPKYKFGKSKPVRMKRNAEELDISRLISESNTNTKPMDASRSQYLHIPVTVNSCGVPEPDAEVFATVYLNYHNGSWDGSAEYRALPTHVDGVFYIQIPNNPASRAKDNLARACATIGTAALKSCSAVVPKLTEYQERICNSTADAFKFIPDADEDQVEDVLQTCQEGFRTVALHCRTLDFTPQDGVVDIKECDRVKHFDDSYTDKPIFVQPVAVYPDGRTKRGKGAEIKITRNMIYHEDGFTLDDNRGGVKLTDVVVEPNDPKPKQRYKVKVTHRCASNKTAVYASVVGSDYYQNEVACLGSKDCNCCELGVAGAAELVVDSVEVDIEDPDVGKALSRHVVVVF